MAARKSTPVTETPPPDVSAPEPTPEPEPALDAPLDDPDALCPMCGPTPCRHVDAASAQPSPPPEPVSKYEISRPEPIRCGGYVLTERGWVLDTEQEH